MSVYDTDYCSLAKGLSHSNLNQLIRRVLPLYICRERMGDSAGKFNVRLKKTPNKTKVYNLHFQPMPRSRFLTFSERFY